LLSAVNPEKVPNSMAGLEYDFCNAL